MPYTYLLFSLSECPCSLQDRYARNGKPILIAVTQDTATKMDISFLLCTRKIYALRATENDCTCTISIKQSSETILYFRLSTKSLPWALMPVVSNNNFILCFFVSALLFDQGHKTRDQEEHVFGILNRKVVYHLMLTIVYWARALVKVFGDIILG